MKTMKIEITGIRPLIMSNPQTVNVVNSYAVAGRCINAAFKAARKKNDEDRLVELDMEQRRNDFAASAYFDADGFYLPDTVILASLKEAARTLRKGKDIDRAVIMTETEARLSVGRSFATIEEAFENARFRMECPARVPPKTGALIWKCRCMIPTGWVTSFTLEYEETLIAAKTLAEVLHVAGALAGIGGWRPKFGRFKAEVTA